MLTRIPKVVDDLAFLALVLFGTVGTIFVVALSSFSPEQRAHFYEIGLFAKFTFAFHETVVTFLSVVHTLISMFI